MRHPRFSLKNAGAVILRTRFLGRLSGGGSKIARNYQKSSRNLKKMLPASKNVRTSHLAFIYPYQNQLQWYDPPTKARTMTRLRLPRVPIRTCIFLFLLIAVILFWVRSRSRADIVGFYTPAGHLQALATDRQGLLVFFSNVPFGREMGLRADAISSSADEFRELHEYPFDATNEKGKLLGFRLFSGVIMPWQWKFNALILPYWALLIPLAIQPTMATRRLLILLRRSRRGQCHNCGYDLRHSVEQCSECGEPIPMTGQSIAGSELGDC